MIAPFRTLLVLAGCLALFGQAMAAAHVHDAEPDLALCDVCLVAGHADEALPVSDGELTERVALPEPVLRAYAAQLAVVPPAVIVPPGRAPPITL